jgi:Mrp family chromosome partitioning ATPase
MALIDRAICKAYRRPAQETLAPPAHALEERERGWVDGLRRPRDSSVDPPRQTRPADSGDTANVPASVPNEPTGSTAVPSGVSDGPDENDVATADRCITAVGWQWPSICDAILASSARTDLQRFVAQLHERQLRQGCFCVLFSSDGPGVGQSSIILSLTRLLCEQTPLRILVVDANVRRPDLAKLLDINDGVRSPATTTLIPGRFDLMPSLPLAGAEISAPLSPAADDAPLRETRAHYDLILIDAGARELTGPLVLRACRAGDAQVRVTSAASADRQSNIPRDDGHACHHTLETLGIIETFVSARPPHPLNPHFNRSETHCATQARAP